MFRKCSGIAVLTSMVSSHPEICKTGMHPPWLLNSDPRLKGALIALA
jgi:hypothetical protein